MSLAIFEHDQFLGARQSSCRAQGFAVSRLVPTVPEDGVMEHAHAEAHFVLVLEGEYVSSAHGASGIEQAPALIYNPPGTVHRDRYRSATGQFLTVAVASTAQHALEEVLVMPDYACVLGAPARHAALQLLHVDANDAISLESQCVALMSATATHYEYVHQQAPAWLVRARDYLRDEAMTAHGLADVAQACGVHPVSMARAFRSRFGCSPGAYQRRYRLNRAAALLASDGASMAEIAQACGYFDQAHFSRAFRKAFGVTPGDYRQRHRQAHVSPGSVRTRPGQRTQSG